MPAGSTRADVGFSPRLSLLFGVTMLCVFTWRVFRSNGWGGFVTFACIEAGLVIGHGGGALAALPSASAHAATLLWIGVAFRIAALAMGGGAPARTS